MIKIIENITEQDYKNDILEYINKSTNILCTLEKAIKKDYCPLQQDTVSTTIHNIYSDIVTLCLKLNIN